jgi:hypothetical protein
MHVRSLTTHWGIRWVSLLAATRKLINASIRR